MKAVSALLLCALLQSCHAGCVGEQCDDNDTETMITNTAVHLVSKPNCSLSIGNSVFGNGSLKNLHPGTVYQISIHCLNCCKEITTVPGVIGTHTLSSNTSSISLSWVQPPGLVSKYKLEWDEGGTLNTTDTSAVLSELRSGTEYTIRVTAVAADNEKEGIPRNIIAYTKPNPVLNIISSPKSSSSVTVTWAFPQEAQSYYTYVVQTYNMTGANVATATVNSTSTEVLDLEPGTGYNISVRTIAGPGSESTEEQTFSYTMPKAVTNLTVSDVNTTAIELTWLRQSDYKSSYSYLVVALQNVTVQENQTKMETFTLTNLRPGELYTFNVFTVVDGVKSTEENTSGYTKPNPVLNITSSPKSSSSVTVTWSYPRGAQSYYTYVVQTYNVTGANVATTTVNSTSTEVLNLEPGTGYNISVRTIAGPGSESTEEQTFSYTMPKAVTNLTVSDVNTTAIQLTWLRQSDYKSSYSYLVVALQNGSVQENQTKMETFTLTHLRPGELYTFNVFTVVEGVKSAGEHASGYTKPNPVLNITSSPKSSSTVTVTWSSPRGAQSYYTYVVQTYNMTGANVATATVNSTSTEVLNLEPGTGYNISVRTIAGPGSESTEEQTFSYTMPKAVTNLTVSDVNTTAIQLTWLRQSDYKSSYSYLVVALQNVTVQENQTKMEMFTLTHLRPGELYTFNVFTVVEGVKSAGEHASGYTIPNAPGSIAVVSQTVKSINFTWSLPANMDRDHYNFSVSTISGSFPIQNNWFLLDDLQSGSRYNISVVTVGAGDYSSAAVIAQNSTRPYGITQLKAKTLNTTTVHLAWSKPLEYKNGYEYRVQTSGCGSHNKSISGENANISELTPGTDCTFCVFVITSDGTEGEENCTSQYTEPETVSVNASSQGSNSSVLVSWTKPGGQVESFKVLLNSTSSNIKEHVLKGSSSSFLFEGLSAGTLYSARVNTQSGPFDVSSGFITNATFPNPPGPIEVLTRTTSSIDIRWEEAPLMTGASFFYKLTHTSSQGGGNITTSNASLTIHSLLSGTSYNFSIVTVGPFDFDSPKVYVDMVTTRPYSVQGLKATTLNTTTVNLVWRKPLEYKNGYEYRVQTSSCGSHNKSILGENANISELTPGTNCTFCVFVITSDGTEGEENCTSQYTEPERVSVNASSQGSNSSVLVSWTKPGGQVESFKVLLNSTSSNLKEQVLNGSSSSFLFEGLSAGTLYSAWVVSQSGPFNVSSGFITNATFPNPPGPIKVLTRTTSSIEISWEEAPLMTGASFFYKLTHTSSQGGGNITTSNASLTIHSLLSGTTYNFSIVTVGPFDFESPKVYVDMVTTRPYSVQELKATTLNTTTVNLVWRKPLEYKNGYEYRVQTSGCGSDNKSISGENANISELTPGTNCTFCVFVITSDGTEGEENCTSQYTEPERVSVNASSQGSNSSVLVSWTKPGGQVESFKVLLNSTSSNLKKQVLNGSSSSFLFEGLSAGTLYSAWVISQSGPFNVSSGFITNATFPNPPGPIEVLTRTTSSLEVRWDEAPLMTGASFFYKLTHTSSQGGGNIITSNTSLTIHSLLSGTSYNFSIVTVGPFDFESPKVYVDMVTTRPYSVQGLKATTLNTTTVNLVWRKPLAYKNGYKYRVQTSGCGSHNKSISGENANISELTPGTDCTFCVFVITSDGTEGEENCTSQYTEPERVSVNASSQGSNSSVLVSWAKPGGQVESFKVLLNSTSSNLKEQMLYGSSSSFLFEGLSAGTLYSARVITLSGPFNVSSGFITNATFPNPPGAIEVLSKTTSSIEIKWEEAPLMAGVSFFYKLMNTPPHGSGYIHTTNTSHSLKDLLPGTTYNISIATIGVMNFDSRKVHLYMVETSQLRVESVIAIAAQEDNITVEWKPADYKGKHLFNLIWESQHGLRSITTEGTNYTIYDLEPGSRYNFSVTPTIVKGTQGVTTWNSSCTNASPVNNLKCNGPNKPNAEIILSWTKPTGQHSGLCVSINESSTNVISNTSHNFTVANLRHNTKYNMTVQTLSCGQPSTPVSRECSTGITDPPIPPSFPMMVQVSSLAHNRFSLQIDPALLNDSNGEVTHVGVLVTYNSAVDETSDLKKYLGNTYNDWKSGKAAIYLATARETNMASRSANPLSIEVGEETQWEGYFNGALDPTGKYKFAIVLFTSLTVDGGLVNYKTSLVSVTQFYPFVTLPQNPVVIGAAIGGTLGVFCVLFIILIGFIIYWKRFSKKESTDIQIHSMRSVAVKVEDFEAYYRKQRADSNCGFAEEFEDLKVVGTAQSKTSALTIENKSKNRYNNVLPYDITRVRLSIIHGSPYDDYINANYMPGYNSRKEFIAAQGPLPATVSEFWRMIWEKNVQTLVMLTRCNEQGRVKCEQYWGDGTKYFDNITVTTTSEIPLDDWTIRDFDIRNVKTAETRSVRQFHFTAWPDHGVPETTELLISFRHLVREHMDQYSRHSPTVVHCSAGVGRTGTFIAIDRLIFQIERENCADIFGIVHDLRMHRTLMVQTEDQYVFLNQCAMDIIRSRTGTNVDLIYQNSAAMCIYENLPPSKNYNRNGHRNA